MMKIFAFLPAVLLLWLVVKLARKGWRLFLALCLAALISGCAGTSNKIDKSPCACDFKPLNMGNFRGEANA